MDLIQGALCDYFSLPRTVAVDTLGHDAHHGTMVQKPTVSDVHYKIVQVFKEMVSYKDDSINFIINFKENTYLSVRFDICVTSF